ncbi:type VI secretion system baseplate subunit TssF [Acerihabitans sp. TG2]|uniref:type VI secretion system baseplate subunit TssF n=1 Tax=Acerihabitans sp. TG2 TaxID=3096008 RepID=UPI002B2259F1|nr:type VI secretion system baseplate subunit TssF [Acerihabitans sp. TG2]MEA9389772.1 type VI secretion system baseplate subunit TssF [Acerihabitans sp. TG2]
MKDDFLNYFDGEMRYLKEAAREFAHQFPDLGRTLGVDGGPAQRDASVERLFQGFALLMARLRQKVDDDIPELTEPLHAHLLPVVNRTLPSTAVVELTPATPALHTREEVLPEGSELLTQPLGSDRQHCPYRTTRALRVHPFTLDNVTLFTRPKGQQALRLRFTLPTLSEIRPADWQNLSLYLHGDRVLQSALYLALSRQVKQIQVCFWQQSSDLMTVAAQFVPRWQSEHDPSLWPVSDSPALCGEIRPWLEYFTGPERYFFMQLRGLETLVFPPDTTAFDVDVTLSQRWAYDLPLPPTAIRMHCVPVINLFRLLAQPLTVEPTVTRYRLRPHRFSDEHTEIYTVDDVAQVTEDQAEFHYVPYSHFRQKGGMLKHDDAWPERYYHTRLQRGAAGLNDTVLMLGGRTHEKNLGLKIRLNLTCTSGTYPRRALAQAVFDGQMSLGNLELSCLTRTPPGMPHYPPTTALYQWQMMSLLHPQSIAGLMETNALRHALSLLDWTDVPDNARRIAGIQQVDYSQSHHPGEGWHGVAIRVALDETPFFGQGDALLFSELLEQFYTQYADIRRFTQLTVTLSPSGTQWAWPERRIERILF